MPNPIALTPDRIDTLLKAVSETTSIRQAVKAAGVARSTVYEHMKRDPAFQRRLQGAMAAGLEALEDEAIRRGFEGIDVPVFDPMGRTVGYRKVYSDRLAELMLRALKPEVYKDRRAKGKTVAQIVPVLVKALKEEAPGRRPR